MLNINIILLIAVIAFLLCGLGVMLVIRYFPILDIPNNRSNHSVPKPRCGGIAVVITIVLSLLSLQFLNFEDNWQVKAYDYEIWVILGGFILLALVSLYDDIKGLPPFIRLFFHLIAAGAVVATIPYEARLFPEMVPFWAERGALVLLLVWFINLYNFMDGIDGITAIETITIGLGIFIITLLKFLPLAMGAYGLFIAFIMLAFLFYNWSPSKIFLGDVGSISVGFILGWLLLKMAYEGLWAGALILPLYYLVDATLTLGKRILKGHKPWEAHKEHFYQIIVQKGLSHSQACFVILKMNAILLFFAVISCYSEKIIAISLIYVLVTMNKTLRFNEPEKTYKEIKNDMIKNFKEEMEEAKTNLNQIIDKKDHNNDN